MAVEAWRSRCELYMRIYPYAALATTYLSLSLSLARRAHHCLPCSPVYSARDHHPSIQSDIASCLLYLLARLNRFRAELIIIWNLK